ncbi:hypothetical protein [Deinococcus multiflagellatus]|uniref:Uncharacterized protein n=1 Tax=Deinococcus multiflagellatus TaxID=1656887 RepID=A0ABW1ZS21_9DEIO|nr:hypothetical protein [Deinococcus multiflagellatus]MBZ9715608.1 hypothetical protein [Deinococcus multiflagellatus]
MLSSALYQYPFPWAGYDTLAEALSVAALLDFVCRNLPEGVTITLAFDRADRPRDPLRPGLFTTPSQYKEIVARHHEAYRVECRLAAPHLQLFRHEERNQRQYTLHLCGTDADTGLRVHWPLQALPPAVIMQLLDLRALPDPTR